jgi:hypothetical protein
MAAYSIHQPRLAFARVSSRYIVYLSGKVCAGEILHGDGKTFYEFTVDHLNGDVDGDHNLHLDDHRGKHGLMSRRNGVLTWDGGLYYSQPDFRFPEAEVIRLSDVRLPKYLGLTFDRFYVLISAEYTNATSTYQLHIGSEGKPMQRIELTESPFVLPGNKFPILRTATGELFSVAHDGIQTWGAQRLERVNMSSYRTTFNEDGTVTLTRRW